MIVVKPSLKSQAGRKHNRPQTFPLALIVLTLGSLVNTSAHGTTICEMLFIPKDRQGDWVFQKMGASIGKELQKAGESESDGFSRTERDWSEFQAGRVFDWQLQKAYQRIKNGKFTRLELKWIIKKMYQVLDHQDRNWLQRQGIYKAFEKTPHQNFKEKEMREINIETGYQNVVEAFSESGFLNSPTLIERYIQIWKTRVWPVLDVVSSTFYSFSLITRFGIYIPILPNAHWIRPYWVEESTGPLGTFRESEFRRRALYKGYWRVVQRTLAYGMMIAMVITHYDSLKGSSAEVIRQVRIEMFGQDNLLSFEERIEKKVESQIENFREEWNRDPTEEEIEIIRAMVTIYEDVPIL